MHWVTTPGTSLPEMQRITTRVSNEIRSIPGVSHTGAHIGQALIMEEIAGSNFAENWISVDQSADFDEALERVEAVAHNYPGLYRNVQTYLSERVEEVLAGAPEEIVVRIYGPDLDVLKAKAEEIKAALSDIEGIEDLHVDLQEKVPQIEIEPTWRRLSVTASNPATCAAPQRHSSLGPRLPTSLRTAELMTSMCGARQIPAKTQPA